MTDIGLLSIAGTVILILLGVIGYFFRQKRIDEKRELNGLKTEDNKLYVVTRSLERSVNKLDKASVRLEANVNSQIEICGTRHSILNKRMELNEDATKKNGIEINKLGHKIDEIRTKMKL